DFPINDDWDYALMLRGLIDNGRLQLEVTTTPTFVLQAYWGALFVHLFGFSHNTLRASTLILAGSGVIGFFFLLRALVDTRWALLGALTLLVNPLFVFHAYSFMTDVPCLSLAVWSLFCYVRAFRRSSPDPRWLLAASSLAAGTYLIRQVGI